MMKKVFALLLAVAMIASVAVLAGCGNKNATTETKPADTASADTKTNDSKTYVIYSDNAFAPFEYLDTATNNYVGVDMDIMAAIAVRLTR